MNSIKNSFYFRFFCLTLILIADINICKGQCTPLPITMPQNQIDLASANFAIACHFAPTIHQMTDNTKENSLNGVSDLIVDIYYDGDEDTRNNWDNLDQFDINDPALNPKIYYSVIWLSGHWIVTYAIYHPRDYAGQGLCCPDNHENDMEGVVYVIDRSTNVRIFGGAVSHGDFLTQDNPNNRVNVDDGTHANRLGEGGTLDRHGIKSPENPCDGGKSFLNPHITYQPGAIA